MSPLNAKKNFKMLFYSIWCKMKTIAIIPARGGSKGIPRKNIRLLADKPLIAYSINAALNSKYINKVIVSTDDDEIAEISRIYGAEVINRPKILAQDDIPLDPVIYHAVNYIEKKENTKYDLVITIQPTSPLLKSQTVDRAIDIVINGGYDTLISVINATHLYWIKKGDTFVSINNERKNRQYLEPIYKEVGAILISKREVITENNRIGRNIYLFELPKAEGIDIDTYEDMLLAENILRRKVIVFRVDGDKEIGLGHVYRAITIADRMSIMGHNILFFTKENKKLGIKKLQEYGWKVVTFKNNEELFEKLRIISPHIMINDILDTSKDYMKELKKLGIFVVNFEDLGDGSKYADLVINALYERSYPPQNHYYGYKYVCLRDEFFIFPKKEVKKEVKQILITFGGTDPNNLTLRTIKAIEKLNLKNKHINIVLGLGYSYKRGLYREIKQLVRKGFNINVKENIKMMAKEIHEADIVITSNGRTIYEVASIGTPCISIAQNEREARHLFVHNAKCIKYLGIAYDVTEDTIASAISELINNYELRKEMSEKCCKYNIKDGINRVLKLIFDRYYEWEKNRK